MRVVVLEVRDLQLEKGKKPFIYCKFGGGLPLETKIDTVQSHRSDYRYSIQ
jgi:hypothetical protein